MGNTMQKIFTTLAAVAIAWPAFAVTASGGSIVVNVITHDATDTDGDILYNVVEDTVGTQVTNIDTDNDGMDDGWEVTNGLEPLDARDADMDNDNDGLSNLEEYIYGTSPFTADTDNDGFTDNLEVTRGTDATSATDYPVSNVRGDVNADGNVDAKDIQTVINAALGLKTDAPADIDQVGQINSVDVQMVINAALAG
jgi:hypothetical protein